MRQCTTCGKDHNNSMLICERCKYLKLKERAKSLVCCQCNRTGLMIRSHIKLLCITCEKMLKDDTIPGNKEKRIEWQRKYDRRRSGRLFSLIPF